MKEGLPVAPKTEKAPNAFESYLRSLLAKVQENARRTKELVEGSFRLQQETMDELRKTNPTAADRIEKQWADMMSNREL
jgi:hypothetical protein